MSDPFAPPSGPQPGGQPYAQAPYGQQPPPARRRLADAPGSVKAVVGLVALQVVLGLVGIPLAFSKADDRLRASLAQSGSTVSVGSLKAAAVVFGVVFGLLYLGLAVAVAAGKRWAWITLLVLVVLGLLNALAAVGSSDNRTALTPVSLLVLLGLLVALLVAPTRAWVARREAAPGYPPPA